MKLIEHLPQLVNMLTRNEESDDKENHCGYSLRFELAKSLFLNYNQTQNTTKTKGSYSPDLVQSKLKTLSETIPRNLHQSLVS